LKEHFRPEFLNRVDHQIVFNALNQQSIRKIVKMHLEHLADRLKQQDFAIDFDQKVINLLAEEGFDPEYGARPVRRVIQERIEAELAEHILKGIFHKGDLIRVTKNKDKLEFMPGSKTDKRRQEEPEPEEALMAD